MKRVVHFEISANDPERLADFYRNVFGWEIAKWEGPIDYWLVTTGNEKLPGINGALKNRSDPSVRTVVTIDVPSVEECIEKITSNGGTVVMPKIEIPGVGFHAYCRDTEGTVFGIIEGGPSDQ